MKRFLAVFIAMIFAFSLSIQSVQAAETGEMLITSEKVSGEVGDILKVNFYLYANLPDDRKLDSLSGSLKYDPEFLSFGTINQEDKDENLSSFMKGKASSFQSNLVEPGLIKFVYIDAYGVDASGFWFQAEFRIEKEGATDFVFNGITYTGLKTVQKEDGTTGYETVTFTKEPESVGGVYTEGEVVPTDGAESETFEPLEPVVQTHAPVTPTPKPENGGQTVPVTTSLPTYSAQPSIPTGLVTPGPAVTSVPMKTPQPTDTAVTPTDTPAPTAESTEAPEPTATAETTPEINETETPVDTSVPDNTATQDPVLVGSDTPTPPPIESEVIDTDTPASAAPVEQPSEEPNAPQQRISEGNETPLRDTLITVGIIVGIVAVVALGAIAIIFILKRRRQ